MSHNTTTIHKKYSFPIAALVVILCLFFLGNCMVKSNIQKEQEANAEARQSTLTALCGKEVEEVIKEYWLQSGSIETLRNPSLIYEIATGNLADMLYSSAQKVDYDKEPFMTVTKSVEVTNLHVIEYSSARFKATACSKEETEGVKPDGTIINPNIFGHCWVFVFIRENEKWKALGYLSTIYPTSFEESPTWLQQVIGEMP